LKSGKAFGFWLLAFGKVNFKCWMI